MAQEKPASLDKILQDIDSSKKDLQEIFSKRTKGLKKIDISKTLDVLDDFSIHLAFDFETAKTFFSQDNSQIPSNIDKSNLNYENFITILKQWLKNVAFLDESENEKRALQDEGKFDKTSVNPNYMKSIKRWNELLDTYSEKLDNQFLNYIGEFQKFTTESDHIVTSSQNIQDSYKIKEIKVPKLRPTDTISVQDLHMILRGFFYDETGFVLVDNPQAVEDFFASVNSYKTLLKCIERYYKEYKKKESDFNYKNARVTMAETLEIFDYFLRMDPNAIILEENEFNKNITAKAQKEEEEKNLQGDPRTLIRETLVETIVKYEKLLEKCKNEDERKMLTNMISAVKQQLNTLRTTETTVNTVGSMVNPDNNQVMEISPIPKKTVKVVDKKKRLEEGLREIFNYIAKQGHVVGKNATFERVLHESTILDLGEFFFFCKTFNLYNETFNKKKAQELFKKTGESHKEVKFDEFMELLAKTANEIFKNEENMSDEDKMDNICLKLGIDAQKSYKEKLHATHLPFSSIDKEMFRFLPESITRTRVKPLVGKSVDDIREDIKKRKEERDNRNRERQEEKSRIQSFKKNYEKVQNQSISVNRSKEDNYSQLQVKSSINKFDLKNKITWDKLENISYSDLKALNDDNFKPTDLFDDNYDEEDQYYLAEYSLTNDKAQKEKQTLELKKNIEEYGKIKPTVRPTQKYQTDTSKILNNESINDSKSQIPGKMTTKNTKAANLSNQILDRANQVDIESKKKEKQLMKNIDEIQSNQLKKGLKTLNKKKISAN